MKLKNQKNYNCKITTDDQQTFFVEANWLHNNKLDLWQGWHCEVGQTRIYVDKNLQVFSGECKNNLLGTVYNFELLESNICKLPRCSGNTDDIMTHKQKNIPE